MASLHESMLEYRRQLGKGLIQQAYKGLMAYFMTLRAYLNRKYPDHVVSGSVYNGFMDMTYFSFFPASLGQRKLKIAIVFLHDAFRFEVWLAGVNKQVQSKYWGLIKNSGWDQYHLVATTRSADSILEHILVDDPDFRDLDALTEQIETGTLQFIQDVEDFLSTRE